MVKRIFLFVGLWCTVWSVNANTDEGPIIEIIGTKYYLAGAARQFSLKKPFFVAILASAELPFDKASATKKALGLRIATDQVSLRSLLKYWREAISLGNDAKRISAHIEEIEKLNGFFQRKFLKDDGFVKNDEIVFTFSRKEGTSVWLNGTRLGNSPGDALFALLTNAWVGEALLDTQFKEGLQGNTDDLHTSFQDYAALSPKPVRIAQTAKRYKIETIVPEPAAEPISSASIPDSEKQRPFITSTFEKNHFDRDKRLLPVSHPDKSLPILSYQINDTMAQRKELATAFYNELIEIIRKPRPCARSIETSDNPVILTLAINHDQLSIDITKSSDDKRTDQMTISYVNEASKQFPSMPTKLIGYPLKFPVMLKIKCKNDTW